MPSSEKVSDADGKSDLEEALSTSSSGSGGQCTATMVAELLPPFSETKTP